MTQLNFAENEEIVESGEQNGASSECWAEQLALQVCI